VGSKDEKPFAEEPRRIVRNGFRFDEHVRSNYMCRCAAVLTWRMMGATSR
jgi:hypothetical protein